MTTTDSSFDARKTSMGIMNHAKRLHLLVIVLTCATSPNAFAGPWMTDYEKALVKAKEENKPMLLSFTGSDWCHWCIKLSDEVFSEKKFENFAEEALVCVTLDSPRGSGGKSKNAARTASMKGRFRVRGVPTIVLLKPDEQEIGRTGYRKGGAEPYVEHLKAMISPHMELATGESEPEPETSRYRTWTSQSGTTVEAELVEHGGGSIKLRKQDGSVFQIKVGLLSQSDREFLGKR